MAKRAPKTPMTSRALSHLPDWILADIGHDMGSSRRRSWTEYLEQMARYIGPTRS